MGLQTVYIYMYTVLIAQRLELIELYNLFVTLLRMTFTSNTRIHRVSSILSALHGHDPGMVQ